MAHSYRSIITGTGSYIPPNKVPNEDFLDRTFLNADGSPFDKTNEEIIQKFEEITGIPPESLVRQAFDGGLERAEEFIEEADGYSLKSATDRENTSMTGCDDAE